MVQTIPPDFIQNLPMHPLVLASFYLDDGSVRDDCYAGKLATQGFSQTENQLICDYLKKWGVQGNVVRHTVASGQSYIRLPAKTFGTLIEIVEPFVRQIPSLIYKLNESRKNTP
jgi:hypothetical protein